MIVRRRRPDGTVHDVDHGPGPVGKLHGSLMASTIGAVRLADALPHIKPGTVNPERTEYLRRRRQDRVYHEEYVRRRKVLTG